MITLIAYLLVTGALVAAGAHLAEALLRMAGRPARWAWIGAMCLLGALAAASPLRIAPGASVAAVEVAIPAATAGDATAPNDAWLLATLAQVRTAIADVPQRIVEGIPAPAREAIGRGAPVTWAMMSGVLLLLLLATYTRFRRAVRRLPVARMLDTRVRVAQASGPAVVGLRDPDIVVPRWLVDASADEQRLVLAHEEEHRRARDPLLLLAGCVAVALVPWHPASWWMLARLRLAVEMDCDARVLARGVARRTYGMTLIDMAARRTRLPLGVPALADHTTHLERRLIAMTPRPTPYRRTRLLGGAAAVLLLVAAACEARLPVAPQATARPTAYFIDGQRVTFAQTEALPASQIAKVDVVKGKLAGDSSIVRIVTKAGASAPAPAPATQAARLIIIDGVRSDADALKQLSPSDIASVDVLKGDAATKAYPEADPAGGVIRVVTKRAH